MHNRTMKALAILAVALLGSAAASAQNLVVNGSFESGLTGWTFDPGPCTAESLTKGTATAGAGAYVTPKARDGTHVFMGDTGAPGTCTIFQDVAIPAASDMVFTYAVGYNYTNFGAPAAPGCSATLDITTTGGVLLQNLYTATGGTDQPMSVGGASLAPYAGTTIRIIGTQNSCADGPVGLMLDNLAVLTPARTVPTLDPRATALLALLLATFGVFALRRRRASPRK